MDVQEDGGLEPDYRLKLNSYDLGVDIELADAVQRLRFEHPETRTVVITSLKERVFCAGANIFMLRGSPLHTRTCGVCADICGQCAQDCDRVGGGDQQMKQCADICRRCAESCRQMATTAA